jgi:RNA polymerase sigma factor (TIGR02999 family)
MPTTPPKKEITELLQEWREGERGALEDLAPLVYEELRLIARRQMRRERRDNPLKATELVHSVYEKVFGANRAPLTFHNRAHFYAVAAIQMRRFLVDEARKRKASKRGGGVTHQTLDEGILGEEDQPVDILILDEVLTRMDEYFPDGSKVVELKVFGGMTAKEIADVLAVAESRVNYIWAKAKAWLLMELE